MIQTYNIIQSETTRIIHRRRFQWQLIIIDGPNLRIRITAGHHMYCKWFFICSIVSVGGGNGRLSRKLHPNARFMCVKYESQYTKSPEYIYTRVRVPIGQKLPIAQVTLLGKGGST